MSKFKKDEVVYVKEIEAFMTVEDHKKYSGKSGMCSKCKEWTDLLQPCCNAPVIYEGSQFNVEDYIIEKEDIEN